MCEKSDQHAINQLLLATSMVCITYRHTLAIHCVLSMYLGMKKSEISEGKFTYQDRRCEYGSLYKQLGYIDALNNTVNYHPYYFLLQSFIFTSSIPIVLTSCTILAPASVYNS